MAQKLQQEQNRLFGGSVTFKIKITCSLSKPLSICLLWPKSSLVYLTFLCWLGVSCLKETELTQTILRKTGEICQEDTRQQHAAQTEEVRGSEILETQLETHEEWWLLSPALWNLMVSYLCLTLHFCSLSKSGFLGFSEHMAVLACVFLLLPFSFLKRDSVELDLPNE